MSGDLSIINLIVQASLVVQIVIGILLAASLISWAIIFNKRMLVRRAQRDADRFENSFWSGGDLGALYRAIQQRGSATGMESIFEFGFREFARLRTQGGVAADMMLEGSRRAMRVAQLKEIERLEHSLATLATVGSVSPYVGLFGTVWGIMSAFSGLGNVQQATLAMVAPGIAEALIATAFGLFAAIPAVVAYNRYADQVSRLELRYDAFIEELSTILQRHAGRGSLSATGLTSNVAAASATLTHAAAGTSARS
jgi:biopolymer transport protein TolQ